MEIVIQSRKCNDILKCYLTYLQKPVNGDKSQFLPNFTHTNKQNITGL